MVQQTLEDFYQKKLEAEKTPLTMEDFYQKKEEERKKKLRETKPANWRKQLVGELVTKAATQSKKMRFLEPLQTKEFWQTASKNLVRQSADFLNMVLGIPTERHAGRMYPEPARFKKPVEGEEAIPLTPGGIIKKEIIEPAWGFATFIPQTGLDLALDPIGTAKDKPLDTLFFLSIVAKTGWKPIEAKIKAGKSITGTDIANAVDHVGKDVLTKNQKRIIRQKLTAPEVEPGARVVGELEITPEQLEGMVEAGGLAAGMKLPKKVGGVRIDKLNAPYDVKLELANQAGRLLKDLRQERVSWEETVAKAEEMGITVERIIKSKKGQAYNAAQLEAARRMQGASIENLIEKKNTYAADPTDANNLAYRAAMDRAGMIMNTFREKKAVAGRALNILNKPYRPGEMRYEATERIFKELGGREGNAELYAKFDALDLDNPAAVNKFLRNISKATLKDKIHEIWINALLSGPVTHNRNITSNAFMLMEKPVVSLGAALVEAPKRLLRKTPEVYFGEAPHAVFGILSGLKEGVRKALYAFQHETTMEGMSKIETRHPTAVKGVPGQIVRLPGRFLIGMDEFFKGVLTESDYHSHAYRIASREGLRGKAKHTRIAELLTEPTEAMIQQATGERLARTFQTELGKFGKGVYQLRESAYPLRYIAPFLRTPMNIPKQAFYRTPLYLPRIMQLAAQGKLKGAPLATEIARAGLGSMTTIAIFMMAKEGMITGSAPTDKNEREMFWRNKQPYSILIGDKWHSYMPVEPLATILGITADVARLWEKMSEGEQVDVASALTQAVTQNFSNKTFLQGANMMFQAMADPERGGERWLSGLAASVVPAVVGQVAAARDPYLRDVQTVLDAVKNRLPGLKETLALKPDIYGRPIKREGSVFRRMTNPFYYKTVDTTPVDIELARLKIYLGQPSRMMGKKKMTPQDYSVMSQDIGETLLKMLKWTISRKEYKSVNDEGKEKIIRSLSSQIRTAERAKYRQEYKEE